MASWISKLLTAVEKVPGEVEGLFSSPQAKADLQEVAALLVQAEPIVKQITALVPNKTVQEITAAYTNYVLTPATAIADNPTAIGNAMLNLGTTLLAKLSPNSTVTKLNTAIQLAVLGK